MENLAKEIFEEIGMKLFSKENDEKLKEALKEHKARVFELRGKLRKKGWADRTVRHLKQDLRWHETYVSVCELLLMIIPEIETFMLNCGTFLHEKAVEWYPFLLPVIRSANNDSIISLFNNYHRGSQKLDEMLIHNVVSWTGQGYRIPQVTGGA